MCGFRDIFGKTEIGDFYSFIFKEKKNFTQVEPLNIAKSKFQTLNYFR